MTDDMMLPALLQTFYDSIEADSSQSWIYADKIVQILAVFANGDTAIKLAMMKANVINLIVLSLKNKRQRGNH